MASVISERNVHTMDEQILSSDAMRALVRIAATIAGSPIAITRRVMSESIGVAPTTQVDEVVLQSYLFAGFPRTLNAARVWREVSGEVPDETAAGAVHLDTTFPEQPDIDTSRARGEEACRTVYGRKYAALRHSVRQLHPALDEWMITDGYGKVLSRPGLTLAQRELCIVGACAASEQMPQLKSHLRGALNCGASREDLALALSALADIVPREALAAAREELNRIKES